MKTPSDLERIEELFAFLQGRVPDGYQIADGKVPQLSDEQAWIVIWYVQELHWMVPDNFERCDVCGHIYDADTEGACLDDGSPPYHFCDACRDGPEAIAKRRLERAALKREYKRKAREKVLK